MNRYVMQRVWMGMLFLATTVGPAWCHTMDLSPDGRRIAVAWPRADGHSELRIVDVATGAIRTIEGGVDAGMPVWSPDGNNIAYSGTAAGKQCSVWLYEAKLRKNGRLAQSVSGPIVWREDSSRLLAFGKAAGVCLTIPDGYPTWKATLQTPQPKDDADCAWVPNTDSIVLLMAGDLWIIEGAEAAKLTTTGDVLGFGLQQDGKAIVWARASKDLRTALLSVYVMLLKERSARRTAAPKLVSAIAAGTVKNGISVQSVRFSPNGERMAVLCSYADGGTMQTGVFSMRLDGTDARAAAALAKGEAAASPVFSRDGRQLAVVVIGTTYGRIVVSNTDGTGRRQVAKDTSGGW